MAKASTLTLRQCIHAYVDDLQIWGHQPKTVHAYTKNVLATFEDWPETQHTGQLGAFDDTLVKSYIR